MNGLIFSFGEVSQLVLLAFSVGILFQRVSGIEKTHKTESESIARRLEESEERTKERLDDVESRQDALELRFVSAIEDLNSSIHGLTVEIKSALVMHDVRIGHMEAQKN
jgi:hypothetical protein